MTVDHSLQLFNFIFIFLFSWIPMTTTVNTFCKKLFQLYLENQSSYPKDPPDRGIYSFVPFQPTLSNTVETSTKSLGLHVTILPHHRSSYVGVLIPSGVSVWELKQLKGQSGSQTALFTHLSSRQLPTESST